MINVEVVYVAEDKATFQVYIEMNLGAVVSDALEKSQLLLKYPETREYAVGIYAKPVSLDRVLKEGDRVEVYRPLALDPKEKRRQAAKSKKK